jgi:hypothetical protein
MRLFQLHRDTDITGVSGTGIVADGIEWPDGTVSIRWRGDRPSVVFWDCVQDAMHVHGHVGATRFVWLGYDGQPLVDAPEPVSATSRGFGDWANFEDTHGSPVTVRGSSAAEYDAVWIFCNWAEGQARAGDATAPHLNADQAVIVRDALNNWLLWLGHAAAHNPPTTIKES